MEGGARRGFEMESLNKMKTEGVGDKDGKTSGCFFLFFFFFFESFGYKFWNSTVLGRQIDCWVVWNNFQETVFETDRWEWTQ